MTEILDEGEIRGRNIITIPLPVRKILNLKVGDMVRWIKDDEGCICVFKVTTRIVNHMSCKRGGE